ncbi:MAG: hypothetical protein ACPGVB_11545, partial [Chitinophagales bacterium]
MPDLKLDKREWSKEKIQSRMLETAGNEWGYSPMNPAAFDPLVSLLIGACSYELEKVAHDIHNTQSRALNRLAQIMTPDVFTTPIPSHALLHARSVEPSSKANEETQVFYNLQPKEEDKTDNPIEVFFTPTSEFTIFDADVQYLIHQGAFYETKSPLNKSHIEKSTKSDPQNARILWLGIAANDEIEDLKNFSFFFDWKNDPDKKHYYELLPMAKWFIEDKRIDCKIGLPIQELGGDSQTLAGSSFEAEFNISQKRAQDVNAIYEGQFVSIKNFEGESNYQIKINDEIQFAAYNHKKDIYLAEWRIDNETDEIKEIEFFKEV